MVKAKLEFVSLKRSFSGETDCTREVSEIPSTNCRWIDRLDSLMRLVRDLSSLSHPLPSLLVDSLLRSLKPDLWPLPIKVSSYYAQTSRFMGFLLASLMNRVNCSVTGSSLVEVSTSLNLEFLTLLASKLATWVSSRCTSCISRWPRATALFRAFFVWLWRNFSRTHSSQPC